MLLNKQFIISEIYKSLFFKEDDDFQTIGYMLFMFGISQLILHFDNAYKELQYFIYLSEIVIFYKNSRITKTIFQFCIVFALFKIPVPQ
jgi:hypothetical protein